MNYDLTELRRFPSRPVRHPPISVTATLRYQTTSKEYVEFLRDEAVTHGFPDDCIERSSGFPTKSRGELLYDMWTTYGRAAPVDMATDGASTVVVAGAVAVPSRDESDRLHLAQNRPNPAGPGGTWIAYYLPEDARVHLQILDVRGRVVRTLVSGEEARGPHAEFWDGRDDGGRVTAAGAYFSRLRVGNEVRTKRMIVLR